NWWTSTNPTNEYYSAVQGANTLNVKILQPNSFVRLKDISLAYQFPASHLSKMGIEKLKIYVDIRNLVTITKWGGLDPELNNQVGIPLQREYLLGLNLGF